MNLAARIAHNSIISSIVRVFSLAIALVSIGFITRYLGTSGFGSYTTVFAFYFLFAAVAEFGINQIFTREISRPNADENKVVANVMGLRLVTIIAVVILGFTISSFLPYDNEIKRGILLVLAGLVFASIAQALNSVFQKRLVMHRMAWRELIGRFLQLGIILLSVQRDWGLEGILLGLVVSNIFVFISAWIMARGYIKLSFSFDKAYWKFFLKESLPLGAAALVNFMYFKVDTILLSLLQSSHDVGIYGAAYKVLESLIYFPHMFMGLVMPIIAYNIFHRPKKFLKIASLTSKVIWVVTLPIIIFLFFLAREVIQVIAGAEFTQAVIVLQILAPALGAIFLAHFFNSILIAANQQKKLLIILTITAFLNVILNIIFIPYYSYMAAAIISTTSEILVVFLAYLLSRKYGVGRGEGWTPMPVMSLTISTLGTVAILFALNQIQFAVIPGLLIKGILGSITYFSLLFLTKGLSIQEIFILLKRQDAVTTIQGKKN